MIPPSSPDRLHRRQFVLGPRPVRQTKGWLHRSIGRLVLSHCPQLRVEEVCDRDTNPWLLLGFAVQTDPGRPPPLESIAVHKSTDVSEVTSSWAGRWLLIGQEEVYTDAAALLNCFYGVRRDATTWASSSPALIRELVSPTSSERPVHKLSHNQGIDWFPPPRAGFSGIRRLLPSQVLVTPEGTVAGRSLLTPLDPSTDYSVLIKSLEERLRTALVEGLPTRGEAWLALTSGYDSRVLLAIAAASGLSVRTYTQTFPWMGLGDRLIPRQLAKEIGAPHALITPKTYSNSAAQLYRQHSAGHVADDLDFRFFSRGQWDFANEGDLCIRGHGVDMGRMRYFFDFPEALVSVERLMEGFGQELEASISGGMGDWLAWTSQRLEEGIDWRHRLHIEQRKGGWLASIEQALDLVDPVRFDPANAADTYALLAAIPASYRRESRHLVDVIERSCPALLGFPVNPKDDDFGRIRSLGHRIRADPSLLFRGPVRKVRGMLSSLTH